jgi:hypothetical protein
MVYINGVLLERGVDYTASNGTTVTGLTALVAGDIATVASPSSFSVANAIPLATVTAKGDLVAATGSGAVTNLAVGADGTTLVANSSASTGVSWSAGTTLANPVLNSCFDIAQRGTSIALSASSSPYTLDRWRVAVDANEASTVSQQPTSDTTNLPNVQYCLRYQRNSGQTGTNPVYVMQYNETTNCVPFAGKQITFSFYARAGANFSSASSVLNAAVITGTGTDQNLWSSGYTNQSTLATKAATLTTTWQRFSVTATMPSNMTEFGYWFYFSPTGTAGANDYYELTGVQIDVGPLALPVRRNASTLQGELAACQRYYYRVYNVNQAYVYAFAYSTTNVQYEYRLPVTMRTTPNTIDQSNIVIQDISVGTVLSSASAATLNSGTPDNVLVLQSGYTALVVYRPYNVIGNGTLGYLGFGAEL